MPTRRSRLKQSRVNTTTAQSVVVKPVKDVVTEQTEVTTEPEVEIRRPATLAEALTHPPVAVIKPKTSVRRRVVERKRVA